MPADNRKLIFGLLALQNNWVADASLATALHDPDRPLSEALVEIGALTVPQRDLLDALTAEHLKRHGGDTERCLAGLTAGPSTRERIARLGDPELTASLARLGATRPGDGREGTKDTGSFVTGRTSFSVSSATSAGQRFRVLRPHAKGGLGEVFVALDAELNREVALKEIQDRHADDADSRGRFVLEAEITGGLEHPGIVPVYGLGTYANGRPYYAMRFIRGDSLKEAIERFHADESLRRRSGQRSLELRKLLRRFVDVCNAIEYAHQRGVLHRDLKPGNVMVGKYGETLVVDWGLAKPLGRPDAHEATGEGEHPLVPTSASGSAETMPGSVVGTPAYMSPEQAAGDVGRIGPSSDVYSLGATLYGLLTGTTAFQDRDVGRILRAVQRGEFPPPRRVDPSIPPALEAVCLKAMALRPEDRYPSPRALADDLERWMADEPVLARVEPWTDRLRRWLRRHRTAVWTAATGLVIAVAAMGMILVLQTRANAHLRAANEAERRATERARGRLGLAMDAVRAYHTGVTEDVLLRQPEMKSIQSRLLRTPLAFYEGLRADLESGGDTRPEDRRNLSDAYFNLARLTEKIGARSDSEAALLKAAEICQKLLDESPGSAAERAALARVWRALGARYAMTNKFDEAEAYLRRALREFRDLDRSGRGAVEARSDLGTALLELGTLHSSAGRLEQARDSFAEAGDVLRQLSGSGQGSPETDTLLIKVLSNAGLVFNGLQEPDKAERVLRECVDLADRLTEKDPKRFESREIQANGLLNLGFHLGRVNRYAEAEPVMARAEAILLALTREMPAVAQWQTLLGTAQNTQATIYQATGRRREAEESYRRALEVYERLDKAYPDEPRYATRKGAIMLNLALFPAEGQAAEGAVALIGEAVATLERVLAAQPRDSMARTFLLAALSGRAETLERLGRHTQALADWDRALPLTTSPEERSKLAAQRLLARVHLVPYTEATDEVNALAARLEPKDSEARFSLALVHDQLAEVAAGDLAASADERRRRIDAHASEALALLVQANAQGLFRNPYRIRTLQNSAFFAAFRRRPEFQALLMDLCMPSNPFATQR
jgi:serine/threonine-protein kinase